jgi:hypothetical protein
MTSTQDPQDLPVVDPDDFVGDPPAGEQDPTAFQSNDQGDPDSTEPTTDPADPAEEQS